MDFQLPELGEGVYEAELVRWLVKPGDVIKQAQALIEVLTDKATMEVAAPFAGTVETLKAEPGQRIKVGDVILTYNDATTQASLQARSSASESQASARSDALLAAAGAHAHPGNGPIATPVQVRAAPSVRQLAHKLGIDLPQRGRQRASWADTARRSERLDAVHAWLRRTGAAGPETGGSGSLPTGHAAQAARLAPCHGREREPGQANDSRVRLRR